MSNKSKITALNLISTPLTILYAQIEERAYISLLSTLVEDSLEVGAVPMTLRVAIDDRENLQKYLICEKTAQAGGIGWKKEGKVAEILCFLLPGRENA